MDSSHQKPPFASSSIENLVGGEGRLQPLRMNACLSKKDNQGERTVIQILYKYSRNGGWRPSRSRGVPGIEQAEGAKLPCHLPAALVKISTPLYYVELHVCNCLVGPEATLGAGCEHKRWRRLEPAAAAAALGGAS